MQKGCNKNYSTHFICILFSNNDSINFNFNIILIFVYKEHYDFINDVIITLDFSIQIYYFSGVVVLISTYCLSILTLRQNKLARWDFSLHKKKPPQLKQLYNSILYFLNYYASLLLYRTTIKPEINNNPIPNAQFERGTDGPVARVTSAP